MNRSACLAAALALSSTATFAAQPVTNACTKVLTPEVAQRILGGSVVADNVNSRPDVKAVGVMSNCGYTLKDHDASVGMMLRNLKSSEQAKKAFLASKIIYKGQDVTGLGDAAYRTGAQHTMLNVLKGPNWLLISAGNFPKSDPALQQKAAVEILKNLHD